MNIPALVYWNKGIFPTFALFYDKHCITFDNPSFIYDFQCTYFRNTKMGISRRKVQDVEYNIAPYPRDFGMIFISFVHTLISSLK